MNEFLYGLTIIILIVVIVVLTRKLRRFKRGSCSKTEFHIGEGITFSHTSCVNPEPVKPRVKPPVTLYSAPQQPINAICPTCNPLATQMDGRSCQIGDILRDEKIVLEQRYRAISEQVSENYRLLSRLREAREKAEWNSLPQAEKVRRASEFLQNAQAQLYTIESTHLIPKQGGNHP